MIIKAEWKQITMWYQNYKMITEKDYLNEQKEIFRDHIGVAPLLSGK